MSADIVRRAEGLAELGRHAEALTLVRQHLATTPDDAQALCVFAVCCLRLGDRRALAAAHAAIQATPDDPTPLCLAAFAAAVQRRTRRSREFADAALALDPHSYDTHFTRAQIETFAIVPSKVGVASAREAVRLRPDEPAAHRVLGELLRRRANSKEAFPHVKEALRLDPNDAASHAALANLRLGDSRPVVAAEGFVRAAAIDPTDERAMHNLVVVTGHLLARLHVVLLLACFWLINPDHDPLGVRISALVGSAAFVAAIWRLLVKVRRALPGRTGLLVRVARRRDKLLVAWVLFLALGFVALLLTGVLPDGPHSPWRWAAVVLVPVLASATRLMRFLRSRSTVKEIV